MLVSGPTGAGRRGTASALERRKDKICHQGIVRVDRADRQSVRKGDGMVDAGRPFEVTKFENASSAGMVFYDGQVFSRSSSRRAGRVVSNVEKSA